MDHSFAFVRHKNTIPFGWSEHQRLGTGELFGEDNDFGGWSYAASADGNGSTGNFTNSDPNADTDTRSSFGGDSNESIV